MEGMDGEYLHFLIFTLAYYFLKEKTDVHFEWLSRLCLRENDIIVYLIKERLLVSVMSFDQCKQRHLHINAIKIGL